IRQGEITQLNGLRTATAARSDQASQQALVNGAVVAALLILAVATLLVVVRSLLRPLRTLRTAAFDVADRQLPEAVEQMSSCDGKPAQTNVDPVPVHSREEVGQVARAFDTVHAQAVRLAAEQAAARSCLNDTFLNLSGRNQGLVDRQRQLIDELRGRQHDPELVGGLLQLDHLAARMRRHSDNLLVLAGGSLPRRTEGPMAVVDVLRSAVSEIEQYQRVTVREPPAAMVAGLVAGDLVHLLAELLDNAVNAETSGGTCQQTTVSLTSTLTGDQGLLVEIVDSGPGLPPDQLQAINDRLASPPAEDASVSRQMGLFVVSRLAAQHGFTVRLRQRLSQIGISTAVSLPSSVVSIDSRPSTSSRLSNDRVPEAPATTEWSGTGVPLPLQVSVIDEATAAELFSPTSIGIAPAPLGGPRTAEQEWRELFSDDQTQPRPESQREPLAGQLDVDQQGGAVSDPLASPLPLSSAAATGQPQEVREEIFEMVSAWFRERQSASASNGDTTEMAVPLNGVPSTNAHEWRSPLDEEWHAAQALATPVDHGVTTAGLPKRQPLAHLVSGAEGIGRSVAAPMPVGPVRVPDDVRGRLSRYQQGLRVGRHARIGPDEQPTMTDTMHGRIEEDQ
ncbi:MAG TPA: ATP-binding protein, partial [Pseudonocardiaceae bacterium]|nr:ATP-binding protein [Pseudonocardiaceae bacterium]